MPDAPVADAVHNAEVDRKAAEAASALLKSQAESSAKAFLDDFAASSKRWGYTLVARAVAEVGDDGVTRHYGRLAVVRAPGGE
jgi:hypothetical protein